MTRLAGVFGLSEGCVLISRFVWFWIEILAPLILRVKWLNISRKLAARGGTVSLRKMVLKCAVKCYYRQHRKRIRLQASVASYTRGQVYFSNTFFSNFGFIQSCSSRQSVLCKQFRVFRYPVFGAYCEVDYSKETTIFSKPFFAMITTVISRSKCTFWRSWEPRPIASYSNPALINKSVYLGIWVARRLGLIRWMRVQPAARGIDVL